MFKLDPERRFLSPNSDGRRKDFPLSTESSKKSAICNWLKDHENQNHINNCNCNVKAWLVFWICEIQGSNSIELGQERDNEG